jgi:uncharacterized membrane protein HdeD (DUF308 family)
MTRLGLAAVVLLPAVPGLILTVRAFLTKRARAAWLIIASGAVTILAGVAALIPQFASVADVAPEYKRSVLQAGIDRASPAMWSAVFVGLALWTAGRTIRSAYGSQPVGRRAPDRE